MKANPFPSRSGRRPRPHRDRPRVVFLLPLVLLFFFCGTSALATPLAIANPGFEDQVHAPNSFTGLPLTGWLPYNDGSVSSEFIGTLNAEMTTYFPTGAPEGVNVAIAFMDAGGTANVEFGIEQTLSATLQADRLYTLEVEVGNIASGSTGPTFFDLDGYNGYRIELRAGTTVLAVDDDTLSIAEGTFATSTVVFDSTGIDAGLVGTPLTIRLVHLNRVDPAFPGAHREIDFDDVRLDAAAAPAPVPLLGMNGRLILSSFVLATVASARFRTSRPPPAAHPGRPGFDSTLRA